MDSELLSLLLFILAVGVWLTIILIKIVFNGERNKISLATSIAEIGEKRCVLADDLLRMISQYKNIYLIFVILFSFIVLIQIVLRGISLAKNDSAKSASVILNSIDPIYFSSWLAVVGCYLIMRQLQAYAQFTKHRCDELKNKK